MTGFGEIVVASGNAGKVAELKAMLTGWNVLGMADFGAKSPVEDGGSLVANARIKAEALRRVVGERPNCLILADDSGLEVDALGGAPGVETAHFGGWPVLLERLAGVQPEARSARFRCVIVAVACGSGETVAFEGVCEGAIATQARGDGGFGYDPVFVPAGEQRTFAEMAAAEKDAVSHRGRAMAQFLAWTKGLRT